MNDLFQNVQQLFRDESVNQNNDAFIQQQTIHAYYDEHGSEIFRDSDLRTALIS